MEACGVYRDILEVNSIKSLIICCLEHKECIAESVIRAQRRLEIAVNELASTGPPDEFIKMMAFVELFFQE